MNESRKGWAENFDEEQEKEMNWIWKAWPVAWVCGFDSSAGKWAKGERKVCLAQKNISDILVKLTSQLFPQLTLHIVIILAKYLTKLILKQKP